MKLSHDPNNTNWTKNTSSFGHKILTAHGWTPGDYLGATNAAHAESYTAANASHIRVVLKDDNLGLGAKKGSGQGPGECTGLDAFQSLLGRLNADDEDEYVQEAKKREDIKKAIYTEQKWGTMRFVKGGLLVGDKIVEIAEAEAERVRNLGSSPDSGSAEVPVGGGEDIKKSRKEKKSKKHADNAEIEPTQKKSKKDKKGKHQDAKSQSLEEIDAERKLRKKEKKETRRKAQEEGSTTPPEKLDSDDSDAERALRKKEKKERKEKKRKAEEESSTSSSKKRKGEDSTADISEEEVPTINPPRQTVLGGRHAVRARYIAQKRLASMDSASLNQVCS